MNKKGADCSLILSKAGYFSEQNSMVKFKPEAYGSRILEEFQNNPRMLSGQNSLNELLEQTTSAMYTLPKEAIEGVMHQWQEHII